MDPTVPAPRPASVASTICLSDGSDDEEVQADDSGFDDDIQIVVMDRSTAATKKHDAEDMVHWNLDPPLEEDEDLVKRIEKSMRTEFTDVTFISFSGKIEMLKLRVAELIEERDSARHELATAKRVLASATQELSKGSRECKHCGKCDLIICAFFSAPGERRNGGAADAG